MTTKDHKNGAYGQKMSPPVSEELPFEVGWGTSLGSLPHTDPDAAVACVLANQPNLPAAPTLPMRSPFEGLLAQGFWGVPGVKFAPDASFEVTAADLDPEAPIGDSALLGEPYVGLRAFLNQLGDRRDPIKLQVTGPVTLGLALTMHDVAPELAFRVALAAVRARARAILTEASKRLPNVPLVMFLDEPALVGTAQLGFPVPTSEIIDLISGALAAIQPHAVTGVHCCGEADWEVILMAGPQVLSLPVGGGATTAAGAISAFVDRGGWLAWGAVPTSAPLGEHAGIYWKTLSAQWCDLVRKGADPVLIRRRSLITPNCGLAQHKQSQAEHVLNLCGRVAASLQEQAVGIRLSVGA